MSTADRFSRDQWEHILHAPFHAYMHVAGADGRPIEAQFRRLTEELAAGRELFPEGTLGGLMVAALTENLDALWAGFRAAARSPKDGLVQAQKTLDRAEDADSEAIRDWVIAVAIGIAEARRVVGIEAVSPTEAAAISDVADWLRRPLPQAD